jgi:hypothetical protein
MNMGGNGAIALNGTGSRATGNRIRGITSTTLGIGDYGVWASNGAKVTISQNYISGCALGGIVFNGPGTQVVGNYLIGNASAAGTPDGTGAAAQIGHLPGFPGCLIEANYIDAGAGSNSQGISLSGSDVSVVGNAVTGQKSHGMLIGTSATANGYLIVGNTVLNSGQAQLNSAGLSVGVATDNLIISGNRFADSQAVHTQNWGVFFNVGATYNQLTMTGNDLTGNLTAGLVTPPLGTNHLISNNLGTANQPGVPTVNAVNDAAAQAAGVLVGGQYRNGSIVMIRVA